jgi:hypothetical protein
VRSARPATLTRVLELSTLIYGDPFDRETVVNVSRKRAALRWTPDPDRSKTNWSGSSEGAVKTSARRDACMLRHALAPIEQE